jgi:hypothetical protein
MYILEEIRPRWDVQTSNLNEAVRLFRVGSTPTLFRQRAPRARQTTRTSGVPLETLPMIRAAG